jgi:DNA polymerase-3 subunit beta
VTSRLIEGEFPNYEQVIPKKTKENIWINTRYFLSAARRASIFTNQESQSVRIDLNKNRMVISKTTPDVGEVREELEAEYTGGEFSIGFNPNFLSDVLKNIEDEKIQFGLTDPEKPGMIKSQEDYTYIVLPMQIT